MQRITKKVRPRKTSSPIIAFLPLLILVTILQGIINIFSEIQCPILLIDLLFTFLYLSTLVLELHSTVPVQAFQRSGDFLKFLGWFLTAKSFIKIQLENGRLATDHPLTNQRKLLSIDPASAAAISQENSKQMQILSSGIYCLDKQQSIRAVFDLRIQTALFPVTSIENLAPDLDSTKQVSVQSPSPASVLTASTRDGYQVGAAFWVLYKYDIEFGQGENPYGFDPSILLKVLANNTTKPGALIDPQMLSRHWIQQVIHTIWQTSISQVSLLDLIPQEQALPSALDDIEIKLRKTLTAEDSNNSAIDQISQSTNDYETAHHLQECGLKILNISLQSFWLPEETEIAIQHHWQPRTKQLVNGLQLLQQQKTVLYQELGEMQAVYAFLRETGRLD
jgi:hypothetical protein